MQNSPHDMLMSVKYWKGWQWDGMGLWVLSILVFHFMGKRVQLNFRKLPITLHTRVLKVFSLFTFVQVQELLLEILLFSGKFDFKLEFTLKIDSKFEI